MKCSGAIRKFVRRCNASHLQDHLIAFRIIFHHSRVPVSADALSDEDPNGRHIICNDRAVSCGELHGCGRCRGRFELKNVLPPMTATGDRPLAASASAWLPEHSGSDSVLEECQTELGTPPSPLQKDLPCVPYFSDGSLWRFRCLPAQTACGSLRGRMPSGGKRWQYGAA